MSKVTSISKNKDAEVFEAICINCQYRFVAVVPEGTRLIDMQCENCDGWESIIKTGEDAERLAYEPVPQT